MCGTPVFSRNLSNGGLFVNKGYISVNLTICGSFQIVHNGVGARMDAMRSKIGFVLSDSQVVLATHLRVIRC